MEKIIFIRSLNYEKKVQITINGKSKTINECIRNPIAKNPLMSKGSRHTKTKNRQQTKISLKREIFFAGFLLKNIV